MTAIATNGNNGVGQFNIARHYDIMAELDRDVHDNNELSLSEVNLVLSLLGSVPKTLFLPCFGTGRHIPYFLDAGVQKIIGVDLSPQCIAKAKDTIGDDPRVELVEADLTTWRSLAEFDAAVLLGNSYADCIDPIQLATLTNFMIKPLKSGGTFIMDYIGQNYLTKCDQGQSNSWIAQLSGMSVTDTRVPSYDAQSRVMTINVSCAEQSQPDNVIWEGFYQKLILNKEEVVNLFRDAGINLEILGRAFALNFYVGSNAESLGMIAQANWWKGVKN